MNERRQFYRKKLTSTGYLIVSDAERKFVLQDISLRGLQAQFDQDPMLQVDQIARIRLPDQGIDGVVTVAWITPTPQGGCLVGLMANRLDGVGDNSYWFRDEG